MVTGHRFTLRPRPGGRTTAGPGSGPLDVGQAGHNNARPAQPIDTVRRAAHLNVIGLDLKSRMDEKTLQTT